MALYHLNEIQGGMLLSGAADGSVRAWRNFSHRGAQRLASAWRVRGTLSARIGRSFGCSDARLPSRRCLSCRRRPSHVPCLPLMPVPSGPIAYPASIPLVAKLPMPLWVWLPQAVPWTTTVTAAEPNAVTPAVFDWAAGRGWLLAAGGTTPSVVHTWDLQHEQKHGQVRSLAQLHVRKGVRAGLSLFYLL